MAHTFSPKKQTNENKKKKNNNSNSNKYNNDNDDDNNNNNNNNNNILIKNILLWDPRKLKKFMLQHSSAPVPYKSMETIY